MTSNYAGSISAFALVGDDFAIEEEPFYVEEFGEGSKVVPGWQVRFAAAAVVAVLWYFVVVDIPCLLLAIGYYSYIQDESHPHGSYLYANNRFLLVCDMGADAVYSTFTRLVFYVV